MLPVDDRLDLCKRARFTAADTDRLREVGGEVRAGHGQIQMFRVLISATTAGTRDLL